LWRKINFEVEKKRLQEEEDLQPQQIVRQLKSRLATLRYQDFLTEITNLLVRHSPLYDSQHEFFHSENSNVPLEERLKNICGVSQSKDYRACSLGRQCLRAQGGHAMRSKYYCPNRRCLQFARPSAVGTYLCVTPVDSDDPDKTCYNMFHAGEIRVRKKRRVNQEDEAKANE